MGVFNWTPAAGEKVISVYFWAYVAIAGVLTIATIVTWLLLTTKRDIVRDECASIESV